MEPYYYIYGAPPGPVSEAARAKIHELKKLGKKAITTQLDSHTLALEKVPNNVALVVQDTSYRENDHVWAVERLKGANRTARALGRRFIPLIPSSETLDKSEQLGLDI